MNVKPLKEELPTILDNLKPGTCFMVLEHPKPRDTFMKLNFLENLNYNAINLHNGSVGYMNPSREVITFPNATLDLEPNTQ